MKTLVARMNEPRRFLQILLGPRQTGKTTAVGQALESVDIPFTLRAVGEHGESPDWIRVQWYQARALITADPPDRENSVALRTTLTSHPAQRELRRVSTISTRTTSLIVSFVCMSRLTRHRVCQNSKEQ